MEWKMLRLPCPAYFRFKLSEPAKDSRLPVLLKSEILVLGWRKERKENHKREM